MPSRLWAPWTRLSCLRIAHSQELLRGKRNRLFYQPKELTQAHAQQRPEGAAGSLPHKAEAGIQNSQGSKSARSKHQNLSSKATRSSRLVNWHTKESERTQGGATGPKSKAPLLMFFAPCHPGLTHVVAAELAHPRIGAQEIQAGRRGVVFGGRSIEIGYRANLWLRSAIRVLLLLAQGPMNPNVRGGDGVYDFCRRAVDWPTNLPAGQRFSVKAETGENRDLASSRLVLQRTRDAICDAVRDAGRDRPSPPTEEHPADLPLVVWVHRDYITLYRNMSGDSLHRRGYRQAMHRASLNESAAAGILNLAGWSKAGSQGVLADPMCGSGTLLIEAALMATHTAPGLFRKTWPFQDWPGFLPEQWEHCCEEARSAKKEFSGLLLGNDIHEGALSLAKRDAKAAGVDHLIRFSCGPCQEWAPPQTPQLVICNPPWGQRLLAREELRQRADEGSWDLGQDIAGSAAWPDEVESDLLASWVQLRTFLKGRCPNAEVYVLSGNPDATRALHMRASAKHQLTIGGVDCRLLHYNVLPPKQPESGAGNSYANVSHEDLVGRTERIPLGKPSGRTRSSTKLRR